MAERMMLLLLQTSEVFMSPRILLDSVCACVCVSMLLSVSKTQTVSQSDCFVPHWAVEMGFLHWWSFF